MSTATQYGSNATKQFTAQPRLKGGIRVSAALTGAVTLDAYSSTFQQLDPGGSTRVVTLPAAASSEGAFFHIKNIADGAAENLTISDGSTIDTLRPGESGTYVCDAADWYVQARTSPTMVELEYSAPTDIAGNVIFVADRAYNLIAIGHVTSTVGSDGGAVTAVVKKAASGTAVASGTAMHSTALDLKATIWTPAAPAVTVLAIAAGDTVGLDVTGTTTAARGCVTLTLVAV